MIDVLIYLLVFNCIIGVIVTGLAVLDDENGPLVWYFSKDTRLAGAVLMFVSIPIWTPILEIALLGYGLWAVIKSFKVLLFGTKSNLPKATAKERP